MKSENFCSICRRRISREEYESYKSLCRECAQAQTTLALEGQAFDFEKEGKLDEAKRLYWHACKGSLYSDTSLLEILKTTGRL